MTKTNYTGRYDKEHIHLGGKIYLSDFNTDYRGNDNTNGSSIAARIESDLRWEKKILSKYRRKEN